MDLWILGYHHVTSTFTRLAFDSESLKQHRFLVTWLPLVVLAGTVGLLLVFGPWVLTSTYLYWQWFHYTRQSYGIAQIYRRKANYAVPSDGALTKWMLYLLPVWSILF